MILGKLKGEIERQRVAEVLSGDSISIAASKSGSTLSGRGGGSEAYEALRGQLERAKEEYRSAFDRLKTLKPEIEHLQHLVERSKLSLIKEFEQWWQTQIEQQQREREGEGEGGGESESDRPPTHASSVSLAASSYSTTDGGAPLPPIGAATASFQKGGGGGATNSALLKTRSSSDTALGSEHSGRTSTRHLEEPEPEPISTSGASDVPLTGDPEADADILAFMRARQRVSTSAKRTDSKR